MVGSQLQHLETRLTFLLEHVQALDHDRAQFMLTYSIKDWQDWQRYVRPEDCVMPHRYTYLRQAE